MTITADIATDWAARPVVTALSADRLAELIDAAVDASDRMLFTATPREELDDIGRWQRLKDLAFAGQLRSIAATHSRADEPLREFAGDEVGLAIGASPTAGTKLLVLAERACELPGLLDAVEDGRLTERHVRAVLGEFDQVQLTLEQRQAVVLILLARFSGQTPGELTTLTRRLILTVDRAAAQARRDTATRGRQVSIYTTSDGQAALHAAGPVEQLAAVQARLRAEIDGQRRTDGDDRTVAQREFDLMVDLLTHGTLHGRPVAAYDVQVIVPFSAAQGGDLELAEIPGFGPILPSTARDLLRDAQAVTGVGVDPEGNVLGLTDPLVRPEDTDGDGGGSKVAGPTPQGPLPAPRGSHPPRTATRPLSDDWLRAALTRLATPPTPTVQHVTGYRPTLRMIRHLQARDRTCVFPGCHRRITDKDHRIPWPLGPTSLLNLQCLCRHHHRAKQAAFTVTLTDDGDFLWTTRSGWQFLRQRRGY